MRQGRSSATATVLFSDLVGSTGLLSQLGEAAFDRVRRAHFEALRHAIERTGGEQVKTLGLACWRLARVAWLGGWSAFGRTPCPAPGAGAWVVLVDHDGVLQLQHGQATRPAAAWGP